MCEAVSNSSAEQSSHVPAWASGECWSWSWLTEKRIHLHPQLPPVYQELIQLRQHQYNWWCLTKSSINLVYSEHLQPSCFSCQPPSPCWCASYAFPSSHLHLSVLKAANPSSSQDCQKGDKGRCYMESDTKFVLCFLSKDLVQVLSISVCQGLSCKLESFGKE